MTWTGAPEIFSGLPVIVVSDALPLANGREFCGVRVVPVALASPDQAAQPALSADILAAIVATSLEQGSLEDSFGRRGIAPPPISINPTRTEAAAFVAEALARELSMAARREASLRQSLVVMRQETEETRSALTRLRQRAPAAMPSQALEAVFAAEPIEGELALSGEFELSVPTAAEIYGLSALSLHLEGRRLAPEDALEVALVGIERSETLAVWRVPASAIPARRDWLALDLPVSLAQARQTAAVVLSGRLGPQSEIAFSRTAPENLGLPVSLRLFVARAPRLATSPFYLAPATAETAADAVSIPARAWTGAKILGAGTLHTTARGDKHVSLQAGADALLIFPEVPLSGVHAVAVRLQGLDDEEITATAALLPADFDGGPRAAEAAAFEESAPQVVRNETAVSLTLSDPPAVAHVAVALRVKPRSFADAIGVRCLGVWLLRRPRQGLSIPLAAMLAPARAPDAFFEDVMLDETFSGETYRHLDVTIQALSEGAFHWSAVKFKLFEEGGAAGLEFRAGRRGDSCFVGWPGLAIDSFGPYYKICGPAELAHAIAALPEPADRRLLIAVRTCLPRVVRSLASRREIEQTQAAGWVALARSLSGEAT